MANIIVNLNHPVHDGMPLTFRAACHCNEIEGLVVNYVEVSEDSSTAASKTFVFKDAQGNILTGLGNLFSKGAYVRVLLDTENGFAYIQNATTNGYLEKRLANVKAEYGTATMNTIGTGNVILVWNAPDGWEPKTGAKISMKTPCASDKVISIAVKAEEYSLVDALGRNLASAGATLFASGVMVEMMLDCENQKAYLIGGGGSGGGPGAAGADGVGIASVVQTTTSTEDAGTNVITVTLTDGKKITFSVKNGSKGSAGKDGQSGRDGEDGNGIKSAILNADYTLTLTFDDGTTYTTPNIRGAAGKDGKDYSFDPSAYDIPVLYLTGDISPIKESKDNEVSLTFVYGEASGTCTLKGQGSSSYANAKELGDRGKFNYTIKLKDPISITNKWEKDETKKDEPGKAWGSQKKYCLKANFIDHTHARNIVSARLWSQIVDSRSTKNANLTACPNNGAVDGFPVAIVLNGEFHGLYTWNIPKDKWMFGMGSGTQEAVICADDATYPAVDFRVPATIDGSDFELEEVTDEDNAGWVATSLNRIIDLCVNSYGADLDSTIAQYLDWESAIDYYIFTVIMDGRDMTGKNYIMATWNGSKWVFSAYDMDSTYGLQWNGYALLPPHEGVTFASFRRHRLMELIYRFKTNALKARYKKLRETVLSEYAMAYMFENFTCSIPNSLLIEDGRKWTALPSTASNSVDHILRWLHHRLAIVDKWVDELPAQETPVAPSNREGNLVASSANADGSVFNGTGYKNGVIINTANSGDTEQGKAGCCVTGFIPVTKNNIIKVTTDHWNISPDNSRIIFYDMDMKPMAYYTQHGFVGLFNGYTNKTAIQDKTKHSVTYGADGMVTLNIAFGASCTNLGYIRIRGVGNGANLVVVREGEIPAHAPNLEPDVVIDNWIPVSTDASGAVYNETGYKNDVRMNTSNVEEEQTKAGMFTTGFIPLKMTDVIRVTSSTWATNPSNAKINFYNAQFKAMACYTANGYVSVFNGYTTGAESNVTSIKDKTEQSVTVGDDGFTTLNIVYGDECTDIAYFRYDGCGSGANAVVKIN